MVKKQAQELLEIMQKNHPAKPFDKIDLTKKGMGFVLLFLIAHDGQAYANSMAEVAKVSRARMAVILSKMEKRGFIIKTPSCEDGRIDIIKITKQGILQTEKMKQDVLEKLEKVIKTIGFEETKKFIDTSIKIQHILDC